MQTGILTREDDQDDTAEPRSDTTTLQRDTPDGQGDTAEHQQARTHRARVATWMRLARFYHRLDRASADLLRRWDLSVAQFDVLAQIGAREGLSQQELADHLLVTKGNISQLLARMVRRGLVRRSQEGRAMALFLTDEGRALHQHVLPVQEALVSRHFAYLSRAELRAFATTLRLLNEGEAE